MRNGSSCVPPLPPMRFDRAALRGWARFDARFGILERAPDVDAAFDYRARAERFR